MTTLEFFYWLILINLPFFNIYMSYSMYELGRKEEKEFWESK